MKHLRILILVLALSVPAATLPACHAPVTVVTPEGKAAFRAHQVVLCLNDLQAAVIQAEETGGLPRSTAKTILTFTVAANRVLKEIPDGWEQTVMTLWVEARKQIPTSTNALVTAALNSVDVVLAELTKEAA